ncbi:molybdenum ABC transporter permease subunit [Niastella yeongjuensis]|uniref:Molybdenum transport system permease n=1 Tax=Niastella yeongjuensis TaxID=354355 RepID=A0A1V9E3X7_9BACT|nr:molybdate ABC transporter permease subunit [Niastella yeongjuensis]OQP40833.1 molybdenum ABC transporter permease subunit [Niastella yeongjuensis]SEP00201.1 molybdate transport system permease protein [Niastella yeongjuensis]
MIALAPLWLTLKLALSTTLILFIIAVPLANWLSGDKGFFKIIVQAIVSMPLVLPPTVIGFYLLLAFSPANFLGHWLEEWLDVRLVFSFSGLLIASVIYSFPFMVHPVQSGLSSLSPSLKEAAYSLGKTRWQTLLQVLLPNIKPSLLTGIVLTFAHTVGEFGVVLMIGGNIPGKTRTASVAIYDEVEAFNYHNANVYAGILLALSFVILLTLYSFNRKMQQTKFY